MRCGEGAGQASDLGWDSCLNPPLPPLLCCCMHRSVFLFALAILVMMLASGLVLKNHDESVKHTKLRLLSLSEILDDDLSEVFMGLDDFITN